MTLLPELFEFERAGPARAALEAAVVGHGGARLAAVLDVPDRLFVLASPTAPGLCFVGAEARLWPDRMDLIHASGVAPTLEGALVSCLGEMVERLSQAEMAGDVVLRAPIAAARSACDAAAAALLGQLVAGPLSTHTAMPADWVRATNIADQREVLVPADWCLRRMQAGPLALPDTPLSTGVAAGPTRDHATTRALLEVVERDAAALWWIGGRRGRPVPVTLTAQFEGWRASIRGGTAARRSWLLDLTTDLAIPVVAALSAGSDGRGLACGLAARATLTEAAHAATLELCQMELALMVVLRKREEGGSGALNDVDRRHLARAQDLDVADCALLHPDGAPGETFDPASPEANVAARLKAAGHAASVVDLTRARFDIPVVAAQVASLQRYPSGVHTPRLAAVIADTGGGARWTHGVALA